MTARSKWCSVLLVQLLKKTAFLSENHEQASPCCSMAQIGSDRLIFESISGKDDRITPNREQGKKGERREGGREGRMGGRGVERAPDERMLV